MWVDEMMRIAHIMNQLGIRIKCGDRSFFSEDLNKIANISNLYIIKVVVVVSLPAIISS